MDNYFPKTQSGMTLIEVMIVIMIIGVLTALAGPSFVNMTQRYRALGEMNAFAGDLQYARSEAIKVGAPVVMCAANAASTDCASADTWRQGWIVYSIPDTATNAKKILKIQRAWTGTDTLTSSPAATQVTFNRDGFTQDMPGAGDVTFRVVTTPANDFALQCMQLSRQGRQHMIKKGTGACL